MPRALGLRADQAHVAQQAFDSPPAMADALADAGIQVVLVTPTHRSRLTAAPLTLTRTQPIFLSQVSRVQGLWSSHVVPLGRIP